MEASRRSASAAGGGALKKPRLAASSSPSPLPSPSRSAAPRGGNYNKRDGTNGAGNNSSNGASRSALQQQQQLLQELVAQYKAALSELTFNSKPIITNLTIIAGENMHAARAIASLVFENILEVPSEQKLPSLYLLDSIVKNIGRDYIKHFASRLPEVFCKAYRQVDPSIHPSMKHLFGTWRGVFSPSSLQLIERELGFQQLSNGSTGAVLPKPDSQIQRASHSIHVNPKYLEARQHLQQPAKGRELPLSEFAALEDAEGIERSTLDRNIGRRTDVLNTQSVQRNQKGSLNNLVRDKHVDRGAIGPGHSEVSLLDVDIGRVRLRNKNLDAIGGSYNGDNVDSSVEQLDRKNFLYGNNNFQMAGSARSGFHAVPTHFNDISRTDKMLSKSWKNAEEEEYSWDDVNTSESAARQIRGTVRKRDWVDEGTDEIATIPRNKWPVQEADHLEFSSQIVDNYPRFERVIGTDDGARALKDHDEFMLRPRIKHEPGSRIGMEIVSDGRQSSGSHKSSSWTPDDIAIDHKASRYIGHSEEQTNSPRGISQIPEAMLLSYKAPSNLVTKMNVLDKSGETFEQQRRGIWRPPSPSVQSPPSSALYRQSSLSSEQDFIHSRSSQFGQKQLQHEESSVQGTRSVLMPQQVTALPQNSTQHTPGMHGNMSSTPLSSQLSRLLQSFPLTVSSDPRTNTRKGLDSLDGTEHVGVVSEKDNLNNSVGVLAEQGGASALLAGLLKSGFVPKNSVGNSEDSSLKPPLPSGPPPSHVIASSIPLSSLQHRLTPDDTAVSPAAPEQKTRAMLPPLPPGLPPPSSFVGTTSHVADGAGSFSGLLSSLVAKGLISSPSVDSSVNLPARLEKQTNESACIVSLTLDSTTDVSTASTSEKITESITKSNASAGVPSAVPMVGQGGLIGLEFKPEVTRKYHPEVISSLYEDLCHQCEMCGLRFRHEGQLSAHSASHASKMTKADTGSAMSRKWYDDAGSRVIGTACTGNVQSVFDDVDAEEDTDESCEDMVPADESQIICALCGEPFQDVYSEGRGEWMYKDAAYLEYTGDHNTPEQSLNSEERKQQLKIVHTSCKRGPSEVLEGT